MYGLTVVLQQNLISGVDFTLGKDMMSGKQCDILFSNEAGQDFRCGLEIVKPPLFGFLDPFVRVTITVEDNLFVLQDSGLY